MLLQDRRGIHRVGRGIRRLGLQDDAVFRNAVQRKVVRHRGDERHSRARDDDERKWAMFSNDACGSEQSGLGRWAKAFGGGKEIIVVSFSASEYDQRALGWLRVRKSGGEVDGPRLQAGG